MHNHYGATAQESLRARGYETAAGGRFDAQQMRRFAFNRERLPIAHVYYAQEGIELRGAGEWRDALCPFHDDRRPSLRVKHDSGAFRCMACGARGSDVLAFHMWRHGVDVIQAAKALGVWRPAILIDAMRAALPKAAALPTLTVIPADSPTTARSSHRSGDHAEQCCGVRDQSINTMSMSMYYPLMKHQRFPSINALCARAAVTVQEIRDAITNAMIENSELTVIETLKFGGPEADIRAVLDLHPGGEVTLWWGFFCLMSENLTTAEQTVAELTEHEHFKGRILTIAKFTPRAGGLPQ